MTRMRTEECAIRINRACLYAPPAAGCRVHAARPAGRRAAAGADRRAHAAGRARRRTTGTAATWWSTSGSPSACRARRGRHGLRRGLRLRRARQARARRVTGVDANPEAHEHARAQVHARPGCASSATWSRPTPSRCDAVVFLQTIEHVEDPRAVLEHFKLAEAGRHGYVSTPNVLTLAPRGRRSRTTRGTSRSTAPRSSARSASARSSASSCSACSTRASCAARAGRSSAAGTTCTRGSASPSRSTTGSRRRSRRATSRCGPRRSTARSTSWRSFDDRARRRPRGS